MPIPLTCTSSSPCAAMQQDFSSPAPSCPLVNNNSTSSTSSPPTLPNANNTHFDENNTSQPKNINKSTSTNCSLLTNLWLGKRSSTSPQHPLNLPLALDHISEFIHQLVNRKCRVVFFLDYDGTLSPIVDDPDSAIMPSTVRTALSAVSSRFTTAIVTGRSKTKVMEMVNLDRLIYAASHGFEIYSPDGRISHRVAFDFLPTMKQVANDLEVLCSQFPGTHVEDNVLSISLHFRHLEPSLKRELLKQVNDIAARYSVRRHDGKMVHELRPAYDWHKGRAVNYLLSVLNLDSTNVVPIYIGDDISDESAFLAVRERGVSIIVADESLSRRTSADLRLKDPYEVGKFLMQFARHENLSVV